MTFISYFIILPWGLSKLCRRDGSLAARMPARSPSFSSGVGEKMVCITFAWKDGSFSQGAGGEESQCQDCERFVR